MKDNTPKTVVLKSNSNYEITDDGRVYSNTTNKWIKPFKTRNGYMRICLSSQGKRKNYLVHRLVAEAYIDNPNDLPCINHIDNNRSNNHFSNLEWCTHKENTAHSIKQGRQKHPFGVDSFNGKKTHCLNGHAYTEENTYISNKGRRRDCRICQRLAVKRYSERKKAEQRTKLNELFNIK